MNRFILCWKLGEVVFSSLLSSNQRLISLLNLRILAVEVVFSTLLSSNQLSISLLNLRILAVQC